MVWFYLFLTYLYFVAGRGVPICAKGENYEDGTYFETAENTLKTFFNAWPFSCMGTCPCVCEVVSHSVPFTVDITNNGWQPHIRVNTPTAKDDHPVRLTVTWGDSKIQSFVSQNEIVGFDYTYTEANFDVIRIRAEQRCAAPHEQMV